MSDIRSGLLQNVKNLVDRKKILEAQTHKGQTALHVAVHEEQYAIVEYLVKTNAKTLGIADNVRALF